MEIARYLVQIYDYILQRYQKYFNRKSKFKVTRFSLAFLVLSEDEIERFYNRCQLRDFTSEPARKIDLYSH